MKKHTAMQYCRNGVLSNIALQYVLWYYILVFMSRSKNLKNTSISIPFKIFERIDSFASSVGLNRNAAMIYLLARGLEYENDFESYMQRKRKRKLDSGYVQDAVENSIKKRMNDKAKQRLERDEVLAISSAVRYDDKLRSMIMDYVYSLSKEDVNNLLADAGWKGYKK